MKVRRSFLGFISIGVALLPSIASAHGGKYSGPGDTVPPGGSGGTPEGPPNPQPGGPGSANPGATTGPTTPSGPAGHTPGNTLGPRSRTGASGGELDYSQWVYWWEFNKDVYLDLKLAVYDDAVLSGGSSWFGDEAAPDHLRPDQSDTERIFSALVRSVSTNAEENDIVTACLIALSRLGDPVREDGCSTLAPILREHLSSKIAEVSESAALALGILGHPDGTHILVGLLDGAEPGSQLIGSSSVAYRTRAFSAYGLGLIGAQTANDALRRSIVASLAAHADVRLETNLEVRVASTIALGLVPLERFSSPKDGGLTSRTTQVDFLIDVLSSSKETDLVRAHAPRALAKLVQAPPLPQKCEDLRTRVAAELLRVESDASATLRQGIALALGEIGDNDTQEIDRSIRRLLQEIAQEGGEPQTVNFAILALGKCLARFGSGDVDEKDFQDAEQFLMRELAVGRGGRDHWAGLALGLVGRAFLAVDRPELPARTGKALRQRLSHERSADSIGAFSVALGLQRDRDASRLLCDRLEEVRDPAARGYVALALGMIEERGALAKIREVLMDSRSKPELLNQAAVALGLLRDKDLVPELCGMLASAGTLSTRAAIASALGLIGDRRSIDPLVRMLEDTEAAPAARAFAAVALGLVADKELLRWNVKIAADLDYRAAVSTLTDGSTGVLDIL